MADDGWASRMFRDALDKARKANGGRRIVQAIEGVYDSVEPMVLAAEMIECADLGDDCEAARNHFRCWCVDPTRGQCPFLRGKEDG